MTLLELCMKASQAVAENDAMEFDRLTDVAQQMMLTDFEATQLKATFEAMSTCFDNQNA